MKAKKEKFKSNQKLAKIQKVEVLMAILNEAFLADVGKAKEARRKDITQLLEQVGKDYAALGVASTAIFQDWDVHAFYRLTKDPSKVVHVQGYPGMSTQEEARLWARLMNYDIMTLLDKQGIPKGNEHEATTSRFPNFEIGIMVPYDAKALEEKLAENCPELR